MRKVASLFCALLMAAPPGAPANGQPPASGPADAATPQGKAIGEPIEVRIVVVTAFEIGEDSGDKAGEFQAWAEGMPVVLPFPAGYRHLRYDPQRKALLVATGIGTNRAASSIMALGMDPRFDLRKAYWLVAAIAGVNPNAASVGSQAWIGDVVDTDYGYAIDVREKPEDWETGVFARGSSGPYLGEPPSEYNLFPLNKRLRGWAYCLTRDVPLRDSDSLAQVRASYAGFPKAQGAPVVMIGDEASGQTFWHGAVTNRHVERWVAYWTGGRGQFVMTAMEDTGVAASLRRLTAAGRADADRLMVLRGGSNYSTPPAGTDPAANLLRESKGFAYSGLDAALEGAFRVGSKVVGEITTNWGVYADRIPEGSCGA